MIKIRRQMWWLAASGAMGLIFLLPLVLPDYRNFIERTIVMRPYAAPFVVIFFRFLGVVLAPLSGAPVTFASIAFLPWWQALIYNFIGAMSGSTVAFFIARRWREKAVRYFAPLEEVHKWQERVSRRREFWTFVGLRFGTIPAFDFMSYAAGLTRMSYARFLAASLLVDIPVGFGFFYVGGIAVRYSFYITGALVIICIAVMSVLALRQKSYDA